MVLSTASEAEVEGTSANVCEVFNTGSVWEQQPKPLDCERRPSSGLYTISWIIMMMVEKQFPSQCINQIHLRWPFRLYKATRIVVNIPVYSRFVGK